MAFRSFYSVHMSTNKSNKGNRSAAEEARYIDEGDEKDRQKTRDIEDTTTNTDIEQPSTQTASNEAEYITDGRNRRREDLAYFETGNIPQWAIDEAKGNGTSAHYEFFRASELFEDSRNTTYREIKFALPSELTKEQNIALIHDILAKTGLDKLTYALAFHDKQEAQLSIGNKNPHVHFMFSERMPDEIERSREVYFKTYKPVNKSLGGCKKDRNFNGAKRNLHLKKIRKIIENTINEHYKKNGFEHWVCGGTKRDIMEAAIARGDDMTTEIAATVPAQRHVGEKAAANPDHPRVIETMTLKAAAKTIRDKYKQYELENEATGQPIPKFEYDKLSSDLTALKNRYNELNREVLELQEKYFTDEPQKIVREITNDTEAKINSLQVQISLTENRLKFDSDPFFSATKMFCKENAEAKKACLQYGRDRYNLEKKRENLAGIEKQITNKYFKNSTDNQTFMAKFADKTNFDPAEHCSKSQQKLILTIRADIKKYENQIANFTKQYIEPNYDKIKKLEPKIIARSNGNRHKIQQLKSQIDELRHPKPSTKQLNDNLQKNIAAINAEKNRPLSNTEKAALLEQVFGSAGQKIKPQTPAMPVKQSKNQPEITTPPATQTPPESPPIAPTPQPKITRETIAREWQIELKKLDSELNDDIKNIQHLQSLLRNSLKNQEKFTNKNDLKITAMANLSGESANTIIEKISEIGQLQNDIKITENRINDLEKQALEKPGKLKMAFLNDTEKQRWRDIENDLKRFNEQLPSQKYRLKTTQSEYDKIINKIAPTTTERNNKIAAESLKIRESASTRVETIKRAIESHTANAEKIAGQMNGIKIKLENVLDEKTIKRTFTAADIVISFDNELKRLNTEKKSIPDTPENKTKIDFIDKEIKNISFAKKSAEKQVKLEAKTGTENTYTVREPHNSEHSGPTQANDTTHHHSPVAAELTALLHLNNPAIAAMQVTPDDDTEYDWGMMTSEQIETAMAELRHRDRGMEM